MSRTTAADAPLQHRHPLLSTEGRAAQPFALRVRAAFVTIAVLHVVGLGLLGYVLLVGGVGVAAVRALSSGAPIAAGASAAAVVWLIHSTIDWDWQVPAVTLPALLLAGALVAASEPEADPAA